MNPLIPQPDPLGLPAEPWLLMTLMAATLVLHWAFVGAAIGAVLTLIVSRGGEAAREMQSRLLTFLPFVISMAVTLGIAPLLFVQVLYGNFFYSANVLGALWWLLVPAAVTAGMYILYALRRPAGAGRPVGAFWPLVVLAMLVGVAFALTGNAVLTQTPQQWTAMRSSSGMSLFVGSHAVERAVFAVLGLSAAGLLAVAVGGKSGILGPPDANALAIRIGTRGAVAASALQLAAGVAMFLAIDPAQRKALWSGGVDTAAVSAAAAVVCAAPAFMLLCAVRPRWSSLLCASAVTLAGMAALALARDALRRAAIAGLSPAPTLRPQWDGFAAFGVFVVVGVAAVAVLLRLARTNRTES